MSRESGSIWAPEPHRREPRTAGPHRRHAWAPILGVRSDGVHPGPGRALTPGPSGHRLGVASRDGRLRLAAPRASGRPPGRHARRRPSELPE